MRQLEVQLWQTFKEATADPEAASLTQLWVALDEVLQTLTTCQQLNIAGEAIIQIAQLFHDRSTLAFEDLEAAASDDGPVMPEDAFDRYVRQTMQVDFDQFIEPALFARQPRQRGESSHEPRSVAETVDKTVLLEVVAQIEAEQSPEQMIRQLAGEEDIAQWSAAIARWLQQHEIRQSISLPELLRGLGMPTVEVWMGLLLGGYPLEQRGEFYEGEQIWIHPQPVS